MAQDKYIQKLLQAWEESYKQGLFSFYILQALKSKERYIGEIKEFIHEYSSNTLTCEDQSLYRVLRKYYDAEMLDFTLKKGHKGPDRKYYFLTETGKKVLGKFTERNISVWYSDKVKSLYNHQNKT